MNIAIIIDNIERCIFFSRVAHALRSELNANITFYTYKYTCNRALRKQGFISKLICRSSDTNLECHAEDYRPLELLRNDLNEKQMSNIYQASISYFSKEFSKVSPEVVFIWNGQQLVESCVANYCKEHGIKTIFWEIGNFPGKMVADPKGVNIRGISKDYLSKARNITSISQSDFEVWAKKLIKDKQSNGARQAKTAKQIPTERFIDLLATYCGQGFKTISLAAATKRLTNKLLNKKILSTLSKNEELTCHLASEYIFFPLQVSTDTQILANSEISIESAVDKAISQSSPGKLLVLKFHPAEINMTFIKKIVKKTLDSDNVFLSFDDTYKLISNSEKVYVINSTVGYEALLMGKDVEFFADTHYPRNKKDFQDLYSYHNNYLVDADYFSNAPISRNLVKQLLERIDYENHI